MLVTLFGTDNPKPGETPVSQDQSIWKYKLPPLNAIEGGQGGGQFEFSIDMPANSKVLHLGKDEYGQWNIWVVVTPDNVLTPHRFYSVGTGYGTVKRPATQTYLGTVFDRGFVWHVFEDR